MNIKKNNFNIIKTNLFSIKKYENNFFILKIFKPKNYKFNSGNFSRLGLIKNKIIIWRAYSISSILKSKKIEFFIKLKYKGLFTNKLNYLKPSDYLFFDKSNYGHLNIKYFKKKKNIWMISNEIGIGPYISMLKNNKTWNFFNNLLLIYFIKNKNYIYIKYINYFKKISGTINFPLNFKFFFYKNKKKNIKKKINNLFKKYKKIINKKNISFMICGYNKMTFIIKKILLYNKFKLFNKNKGDFIIENYA